MQLPDAGNGREFPIPSTLDRLRHLINLITTANAPSCTRHSAAHHNKAPGLLWNNPVPENRTISCDDSPLKHKTCLPEKLHSQKNTLPSSPVDSRETPRRRPRQLRRCALAQRHYEVQTVRGLRPVGHCRPPPGNPEPVQPSHVFLSPFLLHLRSLAYSECLFTHFRHLLRWFMCTWGDSGDMLRYTQ